MSTGERQFILITEKYKSVFTTYVAKGNGNSFYIVMHIYMYLHFEN